MKILNKGNYSGQVGYCSKSAGIAITITTYNQEEFDDRWHCHSNAHFSLVLKGSSIEKKTSAYGRVAGQVTFYSPYEPHRFMRIVQPCKHLNLEVDRDIFKTYDLTEEQVLASLQHPIHPYMLLKIASELRHSNPADNQLVHEFLLQLITIPYRSSATDSTPSWIPIVKEHLHDEWNELISLTELSRETGVHPVTISKYFPKYVGCTLSEYRRKCKVDRALLLLQSANRSLTDIAYECGFFDQSHFIRVFKKMTGFLPAAYQKM